MRLFLLVIIYFLISATLMGQPLDHKLGSSIGFSSETYNQKVSGILNNAQGDFSGTLQKSSLSISGFYDLSYVEISVQIDKQVIQTHEIQTGTGGFSSSSKDINIDSQEVDIIIGAKLKYPFDFRYFSFYPVVGYEYRLNISASGKESLTDQQKSDMNDHFLDLGLGIDIPLGVGVGIRSSIYSCYNLTPTITKAKNLADSLGLKFSDYDYKVVGLVGFYYKLP
jgi:hypothetical protein